MKRKIFSVLLVLVLVLSFSLVTAVPVAATTHQVNPGQSIQAAVNVAGEGDTIIVTAGIYDEQVVIYKSLTLQGAGDSTIIRPSGADTLATVKPTPWIGAATRNMAAIVFVDTADTVTVKNLKIDGTNITTQPTGITGNDNWVAGLAYLETSGTVEGLTVIGPTLDCRTVGIWASAKGVSTSAVVEVTQCSVTGYNRAGIYALGGTMIADYNHNTITGPGGHATQVPNGIFFMEGATGSATYNTISALEYTGGTWRSSGIGTYNAGIGITFAYNTISNVQNAIALAQNSSGTTVEYNTIYDCHTGVRIESGAATNLIHYNSIRNNTYAIRCGGVGGDSMGLGNVAQYNNFVDNTGTDANFPAYMGAVSVETGAGATVTLGATNNWWGHASGPSGVGPGTGDSVSANVFFAPWLTSPMQEPSTVTMTASYIPRIGISVTPTSVNFGSLVPGVASEAKLVYVTNTGNVAENFSASLTNISTPDVYTAGLKITNPPAAPGVEVISWIALNVAAGATLIPQPSLVLTVPGGTAPGTYTATLIFWAEMATPIP